MSEPWQPEPEETAVTAPRRRGVWKSWLFTPGVCLRYTEAQVAKRRRSAPPLRPNWLRLTEGALAKHPCVPPHVWVRCRVISPFGFWIDTTCPRPEHVRDTEVSEIRVADPPEAFRYESPDGDPGGSWDDDLAE